MDKPPSLKPLYWVGSSKRDLLSLPEPVVDFFGYALYLAQDGRKHEQAKPLKGFGSAGVLEVVEDWDRSTYRAVYTVRFEGVVFVLHIFQKKSKRGAATSVRHENDGSQGFFFCGLFLKVCSTLRIWRPHD
jgi:phage-related protein